VFCGDGVYKPEIEQKCAGLPNVRLLPLQPASRLAELLCLADIHLLPQSPQAADLVMPSKLTGMLSSGRPVLATAQPRTELAQVVAGRGVVVPPNDLSSFTAALNTLVETPALRTKLGLAARRYAEEHLARDRVLVDFERALRRCVDETSATHHPISNSINLDVRVATPAGRSDDSATTT
jgi:colanic acid biosynthesis glycosyl transferase WcaI